MPCLPLNKERISSSCSTDCTCRVTLIIKRVISHNLGMKRIAMTTNGSYPSHLWYRYSVTAYTVLMAAVKRSQWWRQLNHLKPLITVASLLAAIVKIGTTNSAISYQLRDIYSIWTTNSAISYQLRDIYSICISQ